MHRGKASIHNDNLLRLDETAARITVRAPITAASALASRETLTALILNFCPSLCNELGGAHSSWSNHWR
jgi:hypothetical protein